MNACACAALVGSSPWTNTYDPPLDDGVMPPTHLRAIEVEANEVFKSYMTAYYESGASSVYCWELDDDQSFAACVLFKKGAPHGTLAPVSRG